MQKFRSFITIAFLLASVITILLIAIFDNMLQLLAVDLINHYLIPTIIVLLIFVVLLSAGIVSNSHRSEGSLIGNGYFQLAILELFLISVGLGYFRYYIQQPGNIVLKLSPGDTKEYITVGLTLQSGETAKMDTVTAPGMLNNRPAGVYRIETLDPDVAHFQTDILLEPMETKTLVIPVALNSKTLAVQTDPGDAEIWIDDIHTANTPYTFEIANRDTVIVALKKEGYQTYLDTVSLAENVDLGTISLVKVYTLRVSCAYPDIGYKIFDSERNIVFSGRGSRALQLPAGSYRLGYEIGEGQYEYKSITLNRNNTVTLQ